MTILKLSIYHANETHQFYRIQQKKIECLVSADIFDPSNFVCLFKHILLDVVNYTDDAVGVGRAPVDDGVHADGDTIARQNLATVEVLGVCDNLKFYRCTIITAVKTLKMFSNAEIHFATVKMHLLRTAWRFCRQPLTLLKSNKLKR